MSDLPALTELARLATDDAAYLHQLANGSFDDVDLDDRVALRSIAERHLALVALATGGAADTARLDWLAKETPVRIGYEDEGFESDRIELVSEHGGINDREFTSVGLGRDLRAAIDAARSLTPERPADA